MRQCLLHYLELFGHNLGEEHRQPRDIAAGPRKARHVADTDRVGMVGEHNGDRLGLLSDGLRLSRGGREDEVDFQTDQVGCQFGQPFGRLSPSKYKADVLPST